MRRATWMMLVATVAVWTVEADWSQADESSEAPVYSRRAGEYGANYGSHGGGGPAYQRTRLGHGWHGSHHPWQQPMRSGWIQRPYPYHLDYYRMRYGGSYEPYSGNLYGPPTYIIPPAGYYGGNYYH